MVNPRLSCNKSNTYFSQICLVCLVVRKVTACWAWITGCTYRLGKGEVGFRLLAIREDPLHQLSCIYWASDP
jgi:hypothetical protein